jgi:two-component system nitrogen regulation response regulator GlnG
VLHSGDTVSAATIAGELSEPPKNGDGSDAGEATALAGSIEHHLTRYFATHGDQLPPAGLYDRIVQEVERPLISICLAATRGNQIRAAHLLGLNRNTLRKKIRDLGLEVFRGMKVD